MQFLDDSLLPDPGVVAAQVRDQPAVLAVNAAQSEGEGDLDPVLGIGGQVAG